MRIALLAPHIFMQDKILPEVIFSPGQLVIWLAEGLQKLGHVVTIFSPGKVNLPTGIKNQTVDLTLFEDELKQRGDDYLDLLKKHPLTFITLARQVQSELIAQAYRQANQDQFDIVHVWCNEEELALVMAQFCHKPVFFTHHEPFNFLTRYRSMFPKYAHLNWISLSYAQQKTLNQQLVSGSNKEKLIFANKTRSHQQPTAAKPKANFIANVYHGLPKDYYCFNDQPAVGKDAYFLYMGRIIQPKGVHLAIAAVKKAGVQLKIAGKHYAGFSKDKFWTEQIAPQIDDKQIKYLGFVKDRLAKQRLIGGAQALLMPSTWEEPFGLVMIEALACGTPVIGFKKGAIPEVVEHEQNGLVLEYSQDESRLIIRLADAIKQIKQIKRKNCRHTFEKRFTVYKMAENYERIYKEVFAVTKNPRKLSKKFK